MRDLAWVEAFLLDCEKVVIGLDASKKTNRIVVEAAVDAREKSTLANFIKQIGGKRSYFEPLLDTKGPASMSLSWGMNKLDRAALKHNLRMMATAIDYRLNGGKPLVDRKKEAEAKAKPKDIGGKEDPTKKRPRVRGRVQFGFGRRPNVNLPKNVKYPTGTPIARVVEPLIATAQKGHADVFVQFVGVPPEKFSMLLGVHVEDGRKLAGGLKDLMKQLQKQKNAPKIEIDAESHRGISFHRLTFPTIPEGMKRIFGESPSMLIGASSSAVWAVHGGEDALPALRKAIDKVIDRKEVGKKASVAAMKFSLNLSHWLAMAGDSADNRALKVAKKAFEKGGDGIRVEIQTTKSTMRVRADFDEGFIRLIGMGVAEIQKARKDALENAEENLREAEKKLREEERKRRKRP